jgi:hypothetical protein
LIAVAVVTIGAFGAAAVAGRRAMHRPVADVERLQGDLLNVDLLSSLSATAQETRFVRVFEKMFLLVLLLYVAFDRAFAWFHVPGTPLFVGEVVVALGVLAMLSTRSSLRAASRHSPSLKALGAWMTWGLVFLVLQLPSFGLDAIRDSAPWYYGVIAFFTVFLLLIDPTRFGRWTDMFGRALPFLLLWFPIAIALDAVLGGGAPFVPDSEIPLFVHRFGNIAVFSGMALGFIWLVDRERGRFSNTQRAALSTLATLGILLAGFQNRGGMFAAVVGILAMLLFLRGRRSEMIMVIAGVTILLATVAVVADVTIPVSSGREISAAQMVDNITSIIDPSSGGDRQTETTQWRLDLWTAVVDDVTTERPLTGWGPGPNLGVRYGVTGSEAVPLRNPHNSHVGILARMGWVGVGMWVILWSVWVLQLLQLRIRLLQRGKAVEAGLAAWLIVSVLMMLVNAVFDPTVEGPQVGFWLWLMFGIGAAMSLFYGGFANRDQTARLAIATEEHRITVDVDTPVDP